jgi:hypothetical protein
VVRASGRTDLGKWGCDREGNPALGARGRAVNGGSVFGKAFGGTGGGGVYGGRICPNCLYRTLVSEGSKYYEAYKNATFFRKVTELARSFVLVLQNYNPSTDSSKSIALFGLARCVLSWYFLSFIYMIYCKSVYLHFKSNCNV